MYHVEPAIHAESLCESETVGGRETEFADDSILAAGIANGSRGSQLPFGPFWITAVLRVPNRTREAKRPDDKLGSIGHWQLATNRPALRGTCSR